MIQRLQDLTEEQRTFLKRQHRGFIRGLARKLEVDHSLVSRIYNDKGQTSERITRALIKTVNRLLKKRESSRQRKPRTGQEGLCKKHQPRRASARTKATPTPPTEPARQ